jgi:hypothetical protein
MAENPPSEIAPETTERDAQEDNILTDKPPVDKAETALSDNGTQNPHSNGISARQLGEWLGVTEQAVRQQQRTKSEKAFAEWTRKRDRDGKAWKANHEGKRVKYYLV